MWGDHVVARFDDMEDHMLTTFGCGKQVSPLFLFTSSWGIMIYFLSLIFLTNIEG